MNSLLQQTTKYLSFLAHLLYRYLVHNILWNANRNYRHRRVTTFQHRFAQLVRLVHLVFVNLLPVRLYLFLDLSTNSPEVKECRKPFHSGSIITRLTLKIVWLWPPLCWTTWSNRGLWSDPSTGARRTATTTYWKRLAIFVRIDTSTSNASSHLLWLKTTHCPPWPRATDGSIRTRNSRPWGAGCRNSSTMGGHESISMVSWPDIKRKSTPWQLEQRQEKFVEFAPISTATFSTNVFPGKKISNKIDRVIL